VAGALLMTRWKPRRLLFVGTLCVFPLALPSAALAVPASVEVLCAVMFLTGVTLEVFGVSWMTALHQEMPEDKLSRVSAYDWFGSVALMPLATALAGPAESAFGRTEALWGCAVTIVRRLRRRTTPVAARQPADDSRALSPTSSTAPGDG
jgi:MFS family permease